MVQSQQNTRPKHPIRPFSAIGFRVSYCRTEFLSSSCWCTVSVSLASPALYIQIEWYEVPFAWRRSYGNPVRRFRSTTWPSWTFTLPKPAMVRQSVSDWGVFHASDRHWLDSALLASLCNCALYRNGLQETVAQRTEIVLPHPMYSGVPRQTTTLPDSSQINLLN